MQTFPKQDWFTNTKTLWALFWTTLALTLTFAVIMQIWQFELIDEMSDPEQIRAHVAGFSDTQKLVHAWMTATIDVAYPFAYGSLFIGMALRFFGRFGFWLALPSVLVIPVDLAEGYVQVMFMLGNDSLLHLKSVLTPLKLALFIPGAIIALIGAGIAFKQRRSQA